MAPVSGTIAMPAFECVGGPWDGELQPIPAGTNVVSIAGEGTYRLEWWTAGPYSTSAARKVLRWYEDV